MALDQPDPGQDIDLVTAALRADSTDVGTFVEALAVKLEAAVPGGVRVFRWRERMFGPKVVRRISVTAGDQRLDLRRQGPGIETTRSKLSGGIVLKSEELDPEAWIQALSEALTAEAARSRTTRQALERLLNA